MNLDELIDDDYVLTMHYYECSNTITGKDLKTALKAEIAEQVKAMRSELCSPDHDWQYEWEYKRCKRCNEVISS